MDRRNCPVWVSVPACGGCGKEQKKLVICTHDGAGGGDLCIKYAEGYEDHRAFEARGMNRLENADEMPMRISK